MKQSIAAANATAQNAAPGPGETHTGLPAGLTLYRRARVTTLADASDVSLVRGLRGFRPVPAAGAPGGSLSIALFSEEAQAKAFQHGIALVRPNDDVTYLCDRLGRRGGGPVFAVIVHFGDSPDDQTVVYDYRTRTTRAQPRR